MYARIGYILCMQELVTTELHTCSPGVISIDVKYTERVLNFYSKVLFMDLGKARLFCHKPITIVLNMCVCIITET